MPDAPNTEPLREWNRFAQQNAENAIVSSMFEAGFKAGEPIELFSTWLLAGTAAVSSFFISNADKLIPFIGKIGFIVCGAFLCTSCVLGLFSKIFALRCKIQISTGAAIRTAFAELLANHKKEEENINKNAEALGITLETGIRMDRVLSEFFKPLPRWVSWLAKRQLNKNAGNPQIGYLPVIQGMQWQSLFCALQAMAFLGFLVSGFAYASTI